MLRALPSECPLTWPLSSSTRAGSNLRIRRKRNGRLIFAAEALTQVHEATTGQHLIACIRFGDGVPQDGHGISFDANAIRSMWREIVPDLSSPPTQV